MAKINIGKERYESTKNQISDYIDYLVEKKETGFKKEFHDHVEGKRYQHKAEDVTYSGAVESAQNVKAGLDALNQNKAEQKTEDGGFAGGQGSSAGSGGAIGSGAAAGAGFAGGKNAKAVSSAGGGIDAIQLGTGTNNVPKSLQVYNKQLLDPDGRIPEDRMPEGYLDDLYTMVKNLSDNVYDTIGQKPMKVDSTLWLGANTGIYTDKGITFAQLRWETTQGTGGVYILVNADKEGLKPVTIHYACAFTNVPQVSMKIYANEAPTVYTYENHGTGNWADYQDVTVEIPVKKGVNLLQIANNQPSSSQYFRIQYVTFGDTAICVDGKGLSSNDYTDGDKAKVAVCEQTTNKNQPNGYAGLGEDGKLDGDKIKDRSIDEEKLGVYVEARLIPALTSMDDESGLDAMVYNGVYPVVINETLPGGGGEVYHNYLLINATEETYLDHSFVITQLLLKEDGLYRRGGSFIDWGSPTNVTFTPWRRADLSDENLTLILGAEQTANKNAPNGYAGLDETGMVPEERLPYAKRRGTETVSPSDPVYTLPLTIKRNVTVDLTNTGAPGCDIMLPTDATEGWDVVLNGTGRDGELHIFSDGNWSTEILTVPTNTPTCVMRLGGAWTIVEDKGDAPASMTYAWAASHLVSGNS